MLKAQIRVVGGGPVTNYFIYLANGHKLRARKII
jgi:hypothetical protein